MITIYKKYQPFKAPPVKLFETFAMNSFVYLTLWTNGLNDFKLSRQALKFLIFKNPNDISAVIGHDIRGFNVYMWRKVQ